MNKNVKIGIIIILIGLISIAAMSLYFSKGDFSELPYAFSSNKIDINAVDYIGVEPSGDYNGTIKSYKVTFTPKEDLHNVSIETYAYTADGTPLDVVANWFGLNSLNILMYDGTVNAGSTQTANVAYGSTNSADFEVSYLKVFVYGMNSTGNPVLESKFTYNLK